MSTRINTEAVHTHLDKFRVALNQVVIYIRMLCVQVHAVACDLHPPARRIIPVAMTKVMPIVVVIIVLTLGVFHQRQTLTILIRQRQIIVRQLSTIFLGVRNHTFIDIRLVFGPVASKHLAQVCFTKVTCVVQHNIQDNLHTALVRFINHLLETYPFRLVAVIHLRKVMCMVAVVVITRCIFYDRCNPNSGKAESFDVIHLLD